MALKIETHIFPSREEITNLLFSAIGLADPDTGIVFTNITGQFPFTRNWGMQYMLILYAYDSSSILVGLIKLRSDSDILRANYILYDTLETTIYAPKLNTMHNDASKELKQLLQKRKTLVKLEPLHINRLNSFKHVIRTCKNHLWKV